MEISKIKDLDVGMSGISTRGKIGYCGESQHIKGEKNGKEYDFWSQFVTIEDRTDKIGASFIIDEAEPLVKGEDIAIEKASLESYVKDGKKNLKLKVAKWQRPSGGLQKAPQATQKAAESKNPDWDAIAWGKVRCAVLCAYIASGAEPDYEMVAEHTEYIMTGKSWPKSPQQENTNPDWVGENPEPIDPNDDCPI